MNNITTENTFEMAIVDSLINYGGYAQGISQQYFPKLGMFKYEIISFLEETQPKSWERLEAIHGSDEIRNKIIQRIYKEMDLRGSFDVIRNGFTDYGIGFNLAFFKPETSLNKETEEFYNKNQLKLYRQVYYSEKKFDLLPLSRQKICLYKLTFK